jgi:betaine-aldehyde dehydrogenase
MLRREYPGLYIGGEWRAPASSEVMEIVNPATGERVGSVPAASQADMDAAVDSARQAFYEGEWPRLPVAERARLLAKLADAISRHQPEFRDLIVDELGCTSVLAEVYQSVAPTLHWNYYAQVGEHYRFSEIREMDLSPFAAGSAGGSIIPYAGKSLVVKEPVGVVAIWSAYNFALPGTAQKAAPALVAGCTVVIKAPEPDPLAIFALGDLISEVGFPPGVINIVAGGGEASAHLASHPDVDMISFTGSTDVGRRIAETCGSLIRPYVLELGGKSAAIVLEDADLDQAVPQLVMASVGTSQGQSCVCMSRILAPRSRYDEVAARLTEAFAGLKIGDPKDPEVAIGPLVSKAQQERALRYVAGAVAEGATVATGGKAPEDLPGGWFVEPTLLTDVSNDMTVAQEEVFGPVIALIPYDDEEDAIRIANDSDFGLAGSVFTSDVSHGFEVARRIRTGTFSENTYAADFNSPFGGFKQSGIGREHGVAGLEEYLIPKTISIDPTQELPADVRASADLAPTPA